MELSRLTLSLNDIGLRFQWSPRSLVLTSRGDTSKGETSLPADHGDSVPSTPRDLAASTFHVNQMTALASAPSNEKVKIGTERRADRALEPNKGDELFIRDRNWTFKDLKLDKLEKGESGCFVDACLMKTVMT